MPLFMDRHDVPGITAEEVARAHLSDLATGPKHGVEFLAYWFDADRGEVFCFARAEGAAALEAVHRESHGLVPNEIIGVSESDVLRFLGRLNDPVDRARVESPFRSIVFTDIEGSTALLERVGEVAYMGLLDEHDLIIRSALVSSRGREVKHTGDGIMASFEDVADALDCALAIQRGFAARGAGEVVPDLRVRIGIAAGQPVDHNDDLFGSTVNLASRICDTADAGHILASEVVAELGSAKGFSFDDGRLLELRGFAGVTRVFELLRARA